jgi:ribA/ribD-fused uncharacterized protein
MKIIKEFQGEFRWLSNFSPVNILYNGINYASVEHAYQSAKSDNPEWKLFCSDPANKAGKIKTKSRKIKPIDGWYYKKVSIMKELLTLKFDDPKYKKLLIDTGNCIIQEGNMWHDTFWGIDLKTGQGNNILGNLIMEIRESIIGKINI